MDWRYADGTVRDTQLNSVFLSWDERLGKSVGGGVAIGYTEGTQADNPIPLARLVSGNWLAIQMRFWLYEQPQFATLITLAYQYTELHTETATQQVAWRWHQGTLGVDMRFAVTEALSATLGGSYSAINGQETLNGTLIAVNNFKQNQAVGGHVGLSLSLDRTGSVSLIIQSGAARGGIINFQRWF